MGPVTAPCGAPPESSQDTADVVPLAPALARAEWLEVRVGLRPLCADGLPVIGPAPGVEGTFVATGHGSAGLLLEPDTGEVVAEIMLGRLPEVDLTPFRPDRFAGSGRS